MSDAFRQNMLARLERFKRAALRHSAAGDRRRMLHAVRMSARRSGYAARAA